jgi:hypothetical protein
MVAKIRPQPHPTYLLADGTPNALGKLMLYAAGTTTLKAAYKNSAKTSSYGSTIQLDAYGKPEHGAIFWDGAYKVVEYYRLTSDPTYALVDNGTTDNFGEADTSLPSNGLVSSNLAYTVDGTGSGATEFATLSAAMDSARLLTIVGDNTITITLSNGTYLNNVVDFTHPQGANIAITGTSEAGTILRFTSASGPVLKITDGQIIKSISNMTLDQQGSDGDTLLVDQASSLILLDNVTLDGNDTAKGLHVTDHSTAVANNVVTHNVTTGFMSANGGVILQEGVASVVTAATGFKAVTGGTIMLDDSAPTLTAVTTSYYPSLTVSEDGTGTLVSMVRDTSNNSQVLPTGLIVSTDTDSSHDLNITSGSAKATDAVYDLVLKTEITKRIDATWAAGDDAGGWESGTSIPVSGIIYIWLIAKPATGVVDILYSLSATSPTMPSGYTKKRRILSWPTDASSNLLPAIHDGLDGVYLTERISDLADTSLVDAREETGTFLCPALGLYTFSCQVNVTSVHSQFFVGTMQTAAGAGDYYFFMGIETAATDEAAGFAFEKVDANRQMRYVAAFTGGADHSVTFFAKGYRDLGRNLL